MMSLQKYLFSSIKDSSTLTWLTTIDDEKKINQNLMFTVARHIMHAGFKSKVTCTLLVLGLSVLSPMILSSRFPCACAVIIGQLQFIGIGCTASHIQHVLMKLIYPEFDCFQFCLQRIGVLFGLRISMQIRRLFVSLSFKRFNTEVIDPWKCPYRRKKRFCINVIRCVSFIDYLGKALTDSTEIVESYFPRHGKLSHPFKARLDECFPSSNNTLI